MPMAKERSAAPSRNDTPAEMGRMDTRGAGRAGTGPGGAGRAWLLVGLAAVVVACSSHGDRSRAQPAARNEETMYERDAYREEREDMVERQIAARGVTDRRVLAAMRAVPRHAFVPPESQREAYGDYPVGIGHRQTISQPFIVALMTELSGVAEHGPGARVLDVGTGSGYQAAVLAELGAEVYGIEIVETLADSARERLRRLGYDRVHVRAGDGYGGWPEHAPFDAIVVAAAPPQVPEPLKLQLAVGGRLVIPVGVEFQELVVITRTATGFTQRSAELVRFVPMTGEAQRHGH